MNNCNLWYKKIPCDSVELMDIQEDAVTYFHALKSLAKKMRTALLRIIGSVFKAVEGIRTDTGFIAAKMLFSYP